MYAHCPWIPTRLKSYLLVAATTGLLEQHPGPQQGSKDGLLRND